LQGVHFRWYMDHKGLIHLLEQKNLSGRQVRWLEKIAEFDFEVIYMPGVKNILSDTLSRLYAYDECGTVCARSEYTYYDVINNDVLEGHVISMPLLVGMEGKFAAHAAVLQSLKGRRGVTSRAAATNNSAPDLRASLEVTLD